MNNGGHVAGWAGVAQFDNHGTAISWIQAGIERSSGGNQTLYIEYATNYQAAIEYSAPASYGVGYQVSIYHVASGSWRATVNGHSYTGSVSPSVTQIAGEAWNTTTACNDYSYQFSVSSWSTSSMGPPFADSPYFISGATTDGWFSGDVLPPCDGCSSPVSSRPSPTGMPYFNQGGIQ